MRRTLASILALGALAGFVPHALGQAAAPETAEEIAQRRIGFYFGISLTKLSQQGMANGIGVEVDRPVQQGFPFPVAGDAIDADFRSRLNLEFMVGFRLRTHGNVEATFFQWDEKQDLLTIAGEGKSIANTLASPLAGFEEDVNGDNLVRGFNAGARAEPPGEPGNEPPFDLAEDVNFSGAPEFIRFDTSDRIVGQLETDYQTFDLDYRRQWKRTRRFTLDWRTGLRWATLQQGMDLAYRDIDSFAVYIDQEADALIQGPCGGRSGSAQDGDGDGITNDADGDGFMNGNCNNAVEDEIESVETVSEDRIQAQIATRGIGLKLGLDGRFDLSRKWRLTGGIAVSVMKTDVEFRYRETFTSERDRFLNYFDWDLNGDGRYDTLDLDFDGSCAGLPPENCRLSTADSDLVNAGVAIRTRTGANLSVVSPTFPGLSNPQGMNPGAFAPGANIIRTGDPVPESERNNDIIREVSVLQDVSGDDSGILPIIDLRVGFEYQFSRLAHLGFGIRTSRWLDAGRFRSIANDVVAGSVPEVDGDFTTSGAYVTLTVIPR